MAGTVTKIASPFSSAIGQDSAIGGAIASAVVGDTTAELGGGKSQNGAFTAAFGYLFNACSRSVCGPGRGRLFSRNGLRDSANSIGGPSGRVSGAKYISRNWDSR